MSQNKKPIKLNEITNHFAGSHSGTNSKEISDDAKTGSSENGAEFLLNVFPTEHNYESKRKAAYAPYNFVPLNSIVVPSEFQWDDVPAFDIYHADRYTGYLSLDIITKKPIFIRDTLDKYQLEELQKIENEPELNKIHKKWEYSDFYSPGNKPRIPGSSLRGLIRTLVEIMSFGKFVPDRSFEDKRLYFRAMADQSNLKEDYSNYGLSAYRVYTMSSGVLYKEGMKYYILDSGAPVPIGVNEAKEMIKGLGEKYNVFNAYFFPAEKKYLVVSGTMKDKKDWIVKCSTENSKKIELSPEEVGDYINDANRSKDVPNVINEAGKKKDGYPVFFSRVKDQNGKDRIIFGHTAMFRVPYKHTIGEHVPENLKGKILDIPEAIFGNENNFAGRVFFEDAFNKNTLADIQLGAGHPHILSGPNPTSFQHYLTQDSDNIKELRHYNPDAEDNLSASRGYKMYWHKNADKWIQDNQKEVDDHSKVYTKINPVNEGINFSGRVRFENLSAVELGALLFAIDLPEGCCHKIGMAKPLGLGSININPTLYLSNRSVRYKDLLNEWSTSNQAITNNEKDSDFFKSKFENYVLMNIDEHKSDLWQVERMKQLKTIILLNDGIGENKKSYMNLKAFRDRKILPAPCDVGKIEI
ncbi:MAG: TIGR03986 family CRISPR-associated RAMP protein [Bacteroidetes bacterium]|nr:TIGR03986 family CRISPR-associated RAMP protein [Bacteroidota bacterium]